jgi:ferredoxin-NADP reductase
VRALQIPALSPGWRWSFGELIRSEDAHPGAPGNAGLVPAAAARTAAPGFRPMRVSRIDRECVDVISLCLEPTEGRRLTMPLAGQFVVLRLQPTRDGPFLFRSYSLSGPLSGERYRVSIKIEPHGAAGEYLDRSVRTGGVLDVSEPRGGFTLRPGDGPVVLLSAGIGATPVLAMLHALAADASPREVWWLHSARNAGSHSFADEARQLVAMLSRARSCIWYSRPDPGDRQGKDYDAMGRLGANFLDDLGVPRESDFYLCGPPGFLGDLTMGLTARGVPADRIHAEIFAGSPPLTPGVVAGTVRTPHPPVGAPGAGPQVTFARSGLTVRWRSSAETSLLELAEVCDVPVRWSCRTGVCHNCESGLISGSVVYQPDPLDPPAQGNVLICCSRPQGDVVIDI